jgi:two-component system, OmpR family, sensor histidine kinase CreC
VSLTTRILAGFVVLALAGFYFLFDPVMDRVERQYLEAAEEPMIDAAELLAGIVSHELSTTSGLPAALGPGLKLATGRRLDATIYSLHKDRVLLDVYITDARGIVLFDSGHPERVAQDFSIYNDVQRTLLGDYGARSTRENEYDDQSSIMYVGAPLIVGGRIVGVLSVYKPQRAMHGFIRETRRQLLTLALGSIAIFLVVGFLLSRWVTEPLARLTRHAEAVTRGERPPPIRLPGRQLQVLADSLERMRDALQDRNYVQSYVQTLSHEMKAPVAAIRGASELLEEKDLPPERRTQFLSNIRTEVVRLQNLIEQLLALASLENRKRLENPQRLDLGAIAARVVNEMQSRGGNVTLHTAGDCPVRGDEFLLATALRNLTQNALDFSPPTETVDVHIRRDGDRIVATVTDSGPGIPDYATDKVFDRFYSLPRPDTGRKSSGLGLCFVRETASLHSGDVTLSSRPGAAGTVATLALPAC